MSSKSLTRALMMLSAAGLSILAVIIIWQILQPTESTDTQPLLQSVPISNLGPMSVVSTPTAPPAASGHELTQKGEWDDAIRDLTRAIQENPSDTNALASRANLRFATGDLDGTISDLSKLIRLNSSDAANYSNRGFTWYKKGDPQKALADLNEALRLKPDDAGALNNLAWVLATCADDSIRDGKRAVTAASRACELTQWTDWHAVGTLAAANAEAGDFDAAVKYQKQAIILPGVPEKDLEDLQQRLALYILRKPAREEPKR